MIATTLTLIALHGATADYFSAFAKKWQESGRVVEVFAEKGVASRFDGVPLTVFTLLPDQHEAMSNKLLAHFDEKSIIITGVGHPFEITLQKSLEKRQINNHFCYYDNPESFVPGGYSDTAKKVIEASNGVLFANIHLQDTFTTSKEKKGVGYYPLERALAVKEERALKKSSLRKDFFTELKREDKGEKIVVYIGGNNDAYFSYAFPHFCSLIEEQDLSSYIFVLQRHPDAARTQRERPEIVTDQPYLENWLKNRNISFVVSKENSNWAQTIADSIIYYQTSMGPGFIFAGIPVIQVAHTINEDLLIKNKACLLATDKMSLLSLLTNPISSDSSIESLREGLGIDSNWFERSVVAIDELIKHKEIR